MHNDLNQNFDLRGRLGRGPQSGLALHFAVAFGFVLSMTFASICMAAETSPSAVEQTKFFESQVRPLLADNCFSCHGEKKQKGGLRLDSAAALLKGGKHGVVVTPGKPGESKIITAVSYKDADLQMPPDDQLSAAQVTVLTEWVRLGAPYPATAGPVASAGAKKHRVITDADRRFWSFQPVKDPPVPAFDAAADLEQWCRNPIDRFVTAKLRDQGLTPAPEADRVTLIRRATFDLHGLPPTPAEVETFVNDTSPDAYQKLIDRLLASARYGERWGRHWLDLVRYAESDGFKQDAYRPNAWPYRDYVIEAFNADKPYNRFVTEQLAGDETAPGDPDALVATGYLRHGVYEYNQRDVPKQWSQMLNDVTDVTADAFLGLSMGCARCHDHKFDPILQTDYFRLQAFFTPMLPRDDLARASSGEQQQYESAKGHWDDQTSAIRAQMAPMEQKAAEKTLGGAFKKFQPEMQAILRKSPTQRTPFEEQLAELAGRQIVDPSENAQPKITGSDKDKYETLKQQLSHFDADRPKQLPRAMAMTDVGPVAPPTTIPDDPDHPLEPGYPVVLDSPSLALPPISASATSTGRRTALAKWLTDPANPLTSRVMVNRVWQYHFGRGLVETSSDYGRLGTPPTHPEMLDWLACRFVEQGWSLKQLHRLIMTSATYRQAAVRSTPETARLKDPDDRWLWRMTPRRLEAEQVRDAMLAVSGELQTEAGGAPTDPASARRSVYTKVLRNTRDALLDVFDSPETFGSVPVRNVTTTANQALLMINGDWPLKRASAFAARLRHDTGTSDPATLVEAAYRLAYGRRPDLTELKAAVEFLQSGESKEKLIDFCHVLLNSNEFLYVD
jgi:hypothetical protein